MDIFWLIFYLFIYLFLFKGTGLVVAHLPSHWSVSNPLHLEQNRLFSVQLTLLLFVPIRFIADVLFSS